MKKTDIGDDILVRIFTGKGCNDNDGEYEININGTDYYIDIYPYGIPHDVKMITSAIESYVDLSKVIDNGHMDVKLKLSGEQFFDDLISYFLVERVKNITTEGCVMIYIGKRRVKAWPEMQGTVNGYTIECSNGEYAWMPKTVFDDLFDGVIEKNGDGSELEANR